MMHKRLKDGIRVSLKLLVKILYLKRIFWCTHKSVLVLVAFNKLFKITYTLSLTIFFL